MISILQHSLFGFDGIHLRAETLLLSAFYTILSIYILHVMNYSLMIIEELFTATSSIVGDVSSMLNVSSKTCKD